MLFRTISGAQPHDRVGLRGSNTQHNGSATELNALPLAGTYRHEGDEDDDIAEWAVPVDWTHVIPRENGFWKPGMFANQNTATKLRNQFTIDQVTEAFGLDD
ncbi:hypothetical protein [Cryobacterium sp. Hh38]|uniref:hypothetical protein n=1 Tax=Cryobacterium sp. Hh38 TaxID=1259156 RepID=UPI001069C1F0|nr:hypothetical protein [Cryobacterium sp. Hh38]TFD59607.1 hypothetical protein E3T41_11225 [Cryobacterium sp. Hh38]